MSITSTFYKAFDPSTESHVNWLSVVTRLSDDLADTQQVNLIAEVNKNPMGILLTKQQAIDWFHIHLVLLAKYAKFKLPGCQG